MQSCSSRQSPSHFTPPAPLPRRRLSALAALVLAIAGCGDGGMLVPTRGEVVSIAAAAPNANKGPGGGGSVATVTPEVASLAVGEALQLTALDANNNPVTANWSSSNSAVASVSSSGLLSALAAGEATIQAKTKNRSATMSLVVSATGAPVASVVVSPSSATVQVGSTTQLSATLRDANGNLLSDRTVYWSSANTAVATVSPSGTVTAVAEGTARITATSEGKSGAADIAVPSPSTSTSWAWRDIGAVGLSGSTSQSGDSFTLSGSGADIWGNADAFHYAYRSLSADGELITRVASQTNTDPWAKAGVMIRESLNADSKHVLVALTPSNGVALQYRTSTGGSSAHIGGGGGTAPVWLRLRRSGSTITASRSADGNSWSTIGSVSVSMNSTVFIGLATTSHNNGALSTARFDVPSGTTPPPPSSTVKIDTIFADGFESGSLAGWQDGVNTSLHRIVTDAGLAASGSRLLEITYPQGSDGGWLTRFFMPGYDSIYVSYRVRFEQSWQGATKLLGIRGSRIDDQWSAFGKAGKCPTGSDFFGAGVVTGAPESQGKVTFYTYYPEMARQPDGTTCYGSHGDGTEKYISPNQLSVGRWHHVEAWVKLNTPGQKNAVQRFWIDGVLRGEWEGISLRTTTDLRLNNVIISASMPQGAPRTQKMYVDDFLILSGRPTS